MPMRPATVFIIRKMLRRNFTDVHTAGATGISLEQLKSFGNNGSYKPTNDQLVALAKRMRLEDYDDRRR